MPLNSDWPTWLQQLSRAVQEAQNCYMELGEARTSCIPVIQQGGLRELQVQAYQLWQSLERYVGPLIQAWEGEVQG